MLAASPEGDLLPYPLQTIHPVPLSRERLSSKQTLQERARALEHRPRLARGLAGACLVEKGGLRAERHQAHQRTAAAAAPKIDLCGA
jgi:hypothetical protein